MRLASRLAVVALTFVAAACGSGISSKEDAANAARIVAGTGAGAQSGSGALVQQGLGAEVAITIPGKSGTAKLTMKSDTSGNTTDVAYSIVYSDFSADGDNTLDGTMDYRVHMSGDVANGSAQFETTMKGTVTLSGTYDAVLEMDIVQSMAVTSTGKGGTVSLTMDGFVKADGTTYDYAQETLTVEVDG